MAATQCAEIESKLAGYERRRILIAAAAAAAVGAPVRVVEVRPVSGPLDAWTRKSRPLRRAAAPRRRSAPEAAYPAEDREGEVES